jgi:flagellin-like protein
LRKTIYKLKGLMRSRKAVSPVIAVILLIAIAVAASVTVFAYTQGMIGGVTQAKLVMSNAHLVDSNTLSVTVQNTGGRSTTVDQVTVTNPSRGITNVRNALTAQIYDTNGDSGYNTGLVIDAGSSVTIELDATSAYAATETISLWCDGNTGTANYIATFTL